MAWRGVLRVERLVGLETSRSHRVAEPWSGPGRPQRASQWSWAVCVEWPGHLMTTALLPCSPSRLELRCSALLGRGLAAIRLACRGTGCWGGGGRKAPRRDAVKDPSTCRSLPFLVVAGFQLPLFCRCASPLAALAVRFLAVNHGDTARPDRAAVSRRGGV